MAENDRPCICGIMARLAELNTHAIVRSPTGGFSIQISENQYSPITYCFRCGGLIAPDAGHDWTEPEGAEFQKVLKLLAACEDLDDIEAVLGKPDVDFRGIDDSEASTGRSFLATAYVYTTKWNSFDLHVMSHPELGIRVLPFPKYVGPYPTNWGHHQRKQT